MNTQYFIRPVTAAEPGPIYQDEYWKIYKNPNAFPHFWVVHSFKTEFSDQEMLGDMQSRGSELHQMAFVADAPGGQSPTSDTGSN